MVSIIMLNEISKLKKLRQEIMDNFLTLNYPGDGNLFPSGYEYDELSLSFKGVLWTDVSSDWFCDYSCDATFCLNAYSHNGFRYYLPAALIIYIDDILKEVMDNNHENCPFVMFLISKLTNGLNNDLGYIFDITHSSSSNINVYTSKQKKVVANFLKVLSELYGLEAITFHDVDALSSYWHKYL